MEQKSLSNYLIPVLLGILIFSSDFLNTDIFNFGEKNFAVWFVLAVLCFACGWYIDKTLNWQFGGKVLFAVVISVTLISVVMIIFFSDYFGARELLTENLILYSLRNIMLGAMGIFGMAIQEVLTSEKETAILKEKVSVLEKVSDTSKKEATLIVKEAQIKAEKIVNDAELVAKNIILKKERIEKELKEFIQTEKELIKRYEEL
jgi:hypothetical protein